MTITENNDHNHSTIDLPIDGMPILSKEATPGMLGEYINSVTAYSEANSTALLGGFLTRFAGEIGSSPHFYIGDKKHSGRLFTAIVGKSSKARKGTSWAPIKRLFDFDSSQWTQCAQSPGPMSTGEGIVFALRDQIYSQDRTEIIDPGIEDKRLLIVEEEFAGTLSSFRKSNDKLNTILRCLWESGDCGPLTKTSNISTTDAHLVILAHITIQELRKLLRRVDAANGFANRFIWILTYRSKLVPLPERLCDEELARYQNWLLNVLIYARAQQTLDLTPAASELWCSIYKEFSAERCGIEGQICGRAEIQLRRLSFLYALIDRSSSIDVQHLESALAFWRYAEESVRIIFDDEERNEIADRIMEHLEEVNECTLTDIHNLFRRHKKSSEIKEAVKYLESKRKAECFQRPTAGRSVNSIRLMSCENSERSETTDV